MKRLVVGSIALLPIVGFAACTIEEVPPRTAGGSAGTNQGAGGQSGSTGVGGSATGGTTGGVGVGGAAAGGTTGGVGVGGSTGGTPPTTGGTGGDATGGLAGTGGSGPIVPADIVGGLDGWLVYTPCGDSPQTDDCNSGGYHVRRADGMNRDGTCSQGRLDVIEEIAVQGTPGQSYQATFHFYGIMEPKNYGPNVQQESPDHQNNNSGVTPPTWAWTDPPGGNYQGTTYNTYEIHVFDNNQTEIGTWFLNYDDEGHHTYVINYEKTLEIVGGGMIRLRVFDSNCRQIKNCTSPGYPCANKARTVDISQANPQPQDLDQPSLGHNGGNDHSGQWWLIDVTSIVPSP